VSPRTFQIALAITVYIIFVSKDPSHVEYSW
jgi:hypothetical protein